MTSGAVKWFNGEKGYGFIAPEDGLADLFALYSQIGGCGFRSLEEPIGVPCGPGGPTARGISMSGVLGQSPLSKCGPAAGGLDPAVPSGAQTGPHDPILAVGGAWRSGPKPLVGWFPDMATGRTAWNAHHRFGIATSIVPVRVSKSRRR